MRGTGRYGKPQPISLPTSSLKTSTQVISRIAKPDQVLRERSVALTVSGRPVIVLQGATPMHRDLGPGDSGEDVRQLERALDALRLPRRPPSTARYDGSTAAAVAQMYRDKRRRAVRAHRGADRPAQHRRRARRHGDRSHAPARLALRNAQRGATRGEVNQAQLDAAAVAELIPPARTAISAARTRIAEARDLGKIAGRLEPRATARPAATSRSAQVDVTAKRNALNDAIAAQADAQRAPWPPTRRPPKQAAARANLRDATAKVPSARAELAAAEAAATAPPRACCASRARRPATTAARRSATSPSRRPTCARRSGRSTTLQRKHRLACRAC